MSCSSKWLNLKERVMGTLGYRWIGQKCGWPGHSATWHWHWIGWALVRLSPQPEGCDTVSRQAVGKTPPIWCQKCWVSTKAVFLFTEPAGKVSQYWVPSGVLSPCAMCYLLHRGLGRRDKKRTRGCEVCFCVKGCHQFFFFSWFNLSFLE